MTEYYPNRSPRLGGRYYDKPRSSMRRDAALGATIGGLGGAAVGGLVAGPMGALTFGLLGAGTGAAFGAAL